MTRVAINSLLHLLDRLGIDASYSYKYDTINGKRTRNHQEFTIVISFEESYLVSCKSNLFNEQKEIKKLKDTKTYIEESFNLFKKLAEKK